MANRPYVSNAIAAQDATAKAVERAKAALKAKGIEYPALTSGEPAETFYERMTAYAEQEAALVVEFLKCAGGPRPIAFDSTKTKDWSNPYND